MSYFLRQTSRRIQKSQIFHLQKRECPNIVLACVGITFASIGVKVQIHNKLRENNKVLYSSLTDLNDKLNSLRNKTGFELKSPLPQIITEGISQEEVGILGVFTGKGRVTTLDNRRLKQAIRDLRTHFTAGQKQKKQIILAALKDYEGDDISESIKKRLEDLCSRSYVSNEDEFLAQLEHIADQLPELNPIRFKLETLIQLIDIRHNVVDELMKVSTKSILWGGKHDPTKDNL